MRAKHRLIKEKGKCKCCKTNPVQRFGSNYCNECSNFLRELCRWDSRTLNSSQRERLITNTGVEYTKEVINGVFPHISTETEQHFMTKCYICKVLIDLKRNFVTERRITNKKPDIIDYTCNVTYEIETKEKVYKKEFDEDSGFIWKTVPVGDIYNQTYRNTLKKFIEDN